MHPSLKYAVCAAIAMIGCAKPLSPLAPSAQHVAGVQPFASRSSSFQLELDITGTIVTLDDAYQPHVDSHARFVVTGGTAEAALDTVPAWSTVQHVRWQREATAAAAEPAAPESNDGANAAAPSPVVGTLEPGLHVLTFQAPDRAGGGTVTVRLWSNFVASSWWAGPDPALWPLSTDGDGRAVTVVDWTRFATTPPWPPDQRAWFGPDSFAYRPAQRQPLVDGRATFYEIWGDRIYARAEGDSVHQDAWLVFVHGGYDPDSRYAPHIAPDDPQLPAGYAAQPMRYALLLPQGPIGSPIGFRLRLEERLQDGTVFIPSQTGLYPVIDAQSVFNAPHVAAYVRAFAPGRMYVVARAQDGDDLVEPSLNFIADVVDRVDRGGGTPEERLFRRRVLKFVVRAPGGA